MSLYLAKVDEFFTDQPPGRNDGQWQKRRRHLLIEADDIHAAWREAERVAEANIKFGPRPLGVEVLQVGSVVPPVEISCE